MKLFNNHNDRMLELMYEKVRDLEEANSLLSKQVNENQLWLFKLASKEGYQFKNNRWVKKGSL